MLGIDSTRAIIIPAARIDNVSVAPGAFVLSPPGPTAFLGLMNKMELDLRRDGIIGEDGLFTGASLIVHEFEVSPGHRRIPPEMRGEHGDKAGSMIDDPEGRMLCSIVLRVELNDLERLEDVRAYLERNLRRYRIGGGRVVSAGVRSQDAGTDSPPVVRPVEAAADQRQLLELLQSLPPGAALADRTPLLAKGAENSGDGLDRLLNLLAWKQRRAQALEGEMEVSGAEGPEAAKDPTKPAKQKPGEATWHRAGKGWLVPVNVGWRALSRVAKRAGMREAEGVLGHAWVEDVVGLGEWISTRKAFRRDGFAQGLFWYYGYYGEVPPPEGPYLVSGM